MINMMLMRWKMTTLAGKEIVVEDFGSPHAPALQ
jgi:hypothetical protein